MKGTENCKYFKTGQYGRLYIVNGAHARGNTFRIQILPKGEIAIPNGSNNLCLNKNAVEVYGVIAGNPGWTEEYGWLHEGKWQRDFEKLLKQRKTEEERKIKATEAAIKASERRNKARINKLLSNY